MAGLYRFVPSLSPPITLIPIIGSVSVDIGGKRVHVDKGESCTLSVCHSQNSGGRTRHRNRLK